MTIDKLSRAFAVVDTEWSDGSPATARLVSIAVERHEPGGTVSSNYWVVNPMTSISAEATEVHGIRNEDVADKPEFATIAGEVAAALRECDIGGYGVRGDVQLIELEMDRAEVDWSPTGAAIIDGLRMWQVLEGRKLEDAYKKFVGPLPDDAATHHAAYDVEMTTAVIAALRGTKTMQEIHDETNENMVDVAGKFPPRPGQAHRVRIRSVPRSGSRQPSRLPPMDAGKGLPAVDARRSTETAGRVARVVGKTSQRRSGRRRRIRDQRRAAK